jgi:hypothetical protein
MLHILILFYLSVVLKLLTNKSIICISIIKFELISEYV